MISVLLADDHDVVRAGVQCLLGLEDDIKIIDEARNGEQAYEAYRKLSPDVLLMDMSMPGIGGLETLKRILARDNKAKVVIFSAHQNTTYATQALANGAIAYVTKSDPGQDLINAIRQAAIGKHYLSTFMAREIALQSMTNFNNPANNLTAREFEIFRLIAEGRSHLDIGKQLNIGQKTVSNYQTTLKQKLDIETAVDFVRLAMRCGVIDNTV
ncbi:MAG: DNA-binding response regulator [Methylophaga sp.]|nr:MAG: DNA-binding response regulator [Methylophaga sp.]